LAEKTAEQSETVLDSHAKNKKANSCTSVSLTWVVSHPTTIRDDPNRACN